MPRNVTFNLVVSGGSVTSFDSFPLADDDLPRVLPSPAGGYVLPYFRVDQYGRVIEARLLGTATLTAAGDFTNPQGQSGSEAFGSGAQVTGTNACAFGSGAKATQSGGVAVGFNAQNTGGSSAVLVGAGSFNSGASAVVVGPAASNTAANAVLVGNSNTVSGTVTLPCVGAANTVSATYAGAVGFADTASHVGAVCVGAELASTRQREFVVGCGTGNGAGAWTSGHRLRVMTTTSANVVRDCGIVDFSWVDSTDASRLGRVTIYAFNGATAQEGVRVDAGATWTVYLAGGPFSFSSDGSASLGGGAISITSGGVLLVDVIQGGAGAWSIDADGNVAANAYVVRTGAADPTATDIPDGNGSWWRNTTSGEIRFWANVAGVMKKSAALT